MSPKIFITRQTTDGSMLSVYAKSLVQIFTRLYGKVIAAVYSTIAGAAPHQVGAANGKRP